MNLYQVFSINTYFYIMNIEKKQGKVVYHFKHKLLSGALIKSILQLSLFENLNNVVYTLLTFLSYSC